MTQTKTKFFLAMVMILQALVATDARADGFRSNHYHRSNNVVRTVTVVRPARRVVYAPRPVYRPTYYPSVIYRPVIYRQAAYRPIVYENGIRAHYHYGYETPCFDTHHTTGIYWDIGIRPGAWGVSFSTGW